ncbi:hypothetical protein [Rubinisphaera margarita]|uniref:hypothetical protein n=1 Tax=Rubinisphaera margarita TaxID=2909586 RepID=UPI001EE881B9|nr:hypothetical protein [Rubinisphaera margarita]MCG6156190.1 hypothetical protein [Rubinisphaera margarita]
MIMPSSPFDENAAWGDIRVKLHARLKRKDGATIHVLKLCQTDVPNTPRFIEHLSMIVSEIPTQPRFVFDFQNVNSLSEYALEEVVAVSLLLMDLRGSVVFSSTNSTVREQLTDRSFDCGVRYTPRLRSALELLKDNTGLREID